MAERAEDLVGDPDDFLLLAEESVVVAAPLEAVWDAIEGDRQRAMLAALSTRFVARNLDATLPDGYRATTVAKGRLGRRSSYRSTVWHDPPAAGRARSIELQLGERTDLRYEHDFVESDGQTTVTCRQSYRAKSATFESGPAIGQLRRRALDVVEARVAAIGEITG